MREFWRRAGVPRMIRTWGGFLFAAAPCLLWAGLTARAGELPAFREQTVAAGLKMGYQIVACDINRDGRKDLLAVDERASELAWYENPGWQRHTLISGVPRPINADAWDTDGDGIPEIALAYQFGTNPETSAGILVLLTHGADVRRPWTARELDRAPTAHRVRWIDPDGKGKKLLMMAPMVGLRARTPLYDDTVPIFAYRPGEWTRETVSNDLRGILHAINPVIWKGGASQQVLTAGFQGLGLIEMKKRRWRSSALAQGDPRPCPLCGSSEARVGRLGRQRFIAAVEPWHGNQVAVYLRRGKTLQRVVIDDGMSNGHALAVGDLDGDGHDEIVSGFRGKGYRLSIFRAAADGGSWHRSVLDDGGIAAADCAIEDLTGDGRPDVVCIGASTGNIKLYENTGK